MKKITCTLMLAFCLSSCTYNPFIDNNRTTGDATGAIVGAGVGAGGVGLLGGTRPMMVAAGLGGGALGYYVTTLRYDSGGIVQAGGQVYSVGQTVGIYIPSDKLFELNSDELRPQAPQILDSVAVVLQRYPNNNIIISGNTSGFGRAHWEQRLSQRRAQKVSAYLWSSGGINQFKEPGNDLRKLNYVGYGDYFPIAADLTNNGIRENSRIQITSYPTDCDLHLDKQHIALRNMGSLDDDGLRTASVNKCKNVGPDGDINECFNSDN